MWDDDVARGAIDEAFYLRTVPMGRIGDPADVGKLAVYLCSDDAAYVTGGLLHDRRRPDVDPRRLSKLWRDRALARARGSD